MKDLSEASYILGIKLFRDRKKRLLGFSQVNYIDKILARFSMQDSKKGFSPFKHGVHLSKKMCPKTQEERGKMRNCPYASAVGSLMYAMLCTRLDICYAMSIVSRYQSNPGLEHWMAVKHILKYLNKTKHYFLMFGSEDFNIQRYTDSDFQSDIDDRKSISRFVFTLGKGAISWRSCKQDTTADSTT